MFDGDTTVHGLWAVSPPPLPPPTSLLSSPSSLSSPSPPLPARLSTWVAFPSRHELPLSSLSPSLSASFSQVFPAPHAARGEGCVALIPLGGERGRGSVSECVCVGVCRRVRESGCVGVIV